MSNRNRAARRAEKVPTPAAAPTLPASPDDDIAYDMKWSGAELNLVANLCDAWIKAGGAQVVHLAMPLLKKVTAPRREAMKAKAGA
ncbi:MAG TPA: hypothetical protein VFM24_02910 [Nitrospira sp.]|nr:hypothetical protein [Nitrospira sp.]